jgi:MOSC domain-containing protein
VSRARTWTVASLWRYPVKSMMGEEANASDVSLDGLLGDRAHGLIDSETGKLASAKRPRLWGGLLRLRANFVEEPHANAPLPAVRITLPDGRVVRSDDQDVDPTLSQALGRSVTLASRAPVSTVFEEDWLKDAKGEPSEVSSPGEEGETIVQWIASTGASRGTFFDAHPVHVVTTATLDYLRELSPSSRFDPRRFRPNIIVRTEGDEGLVENAWIDRVVAVGAETRLRVVGPAVRCVMTTLPQADLPNDPDILRTVARHSRVAVDTRTLPCVGVYAEVLFEGTIRRGDSVILV